MRIYEYTEGFGWEVVFRGTAKACNQYINDNASYYFEDNKFEQIRKSRDIYMVDADSIKYL